jgi:hypothetical protein
MVAVDTDFLQWRARDIAGPRCQSKYVSSLGDDTQCYDYVRIF